MAVQSKWECVFQLLQTVAEIGYFLTYARLEICLQKDEMFKSK